MYSTNEEGSMAVANALRKRRSYYNLNKELPVSEDEVKSLLKEITELVPMLSI